MSRPVLSHLTRLSHDLLSQSIKPGASGKGLTTQELYRLVLSSDELKAASSQPSPLPSSSSSAATSTSTKTSRDANIRGTITEKREEILSKRYFKTTVLQNLVDRGLVKKIHVLIDPSASISASTSTSDSAAASGNPSVEVSKAGKGKKSAKNTTPSIVSKWVWSIPPSSPTPSPSATSASTTSASPSTTTISSTPPRPSIKKSKTTIVTPAPTSPSSELELRRKAGEFSHLNVRRRRKRMEGALEEIRARWKIERRLDKEGQEGGLPLAS
ncbi:hypothetical protein SISSUDRAFT_1066492 [Sistotremastrum suecicum HHB10207 ss-3]|uniref:Uncharacterized protein n=1 Tax=Sistotremastrum suecicum HHB10207 ss-3 TaxID=1314776 RepID=A0A165Y9E2_9AGAM|nr:hypothetical protein SISSUDRAFT_1066492 [Sistotremastrum suecicum HHB10207 ss-3]